MCEPEDLDVRGVPPPRTYRLVGREPVPEPDLRAWANWYATADRRVALTPITPHLYVSTVFLGVDYQWGDGPPLLFETMVFRTGRPWEDMDRSTTYEEKKRGHAVAVQWLRRTGVQWEDMDRYTTYAEAEAGHAVAVQWLRTRLWLDMED